MGFLVGRLDEKLAALRCTGLMESSCFVQLEYREPLSGVGRMPGGRSKSEGGPNDREAETAMLIEKAIMPLFPAGFNHNITVSPQHP